MTKRLCLDYRYRRDSTGGCASRSSLSAKFDGRLRLVTIAGFDAQAFRRHSRRYDGRDWARIEPEGVMDLRPDPRHVNAGQDVRHALC
jgi:hypothetical protein